MVEVEVKATSSFNFGEVRVLLVNVSMPARVAKVPVVGKVTLVDPVVVSVRAFVAVRVKTSPPAKVMELVARVVESETVRVFPSAIVSVAEVAGAVMATLLILVAVATPKVGVVSDGEEARTIAPVPVVPLLKLEAAGWEQVKLPEAAMEVA